MNRSIEKIPTWALNWLINGDDSGLSEADMEEINTWLANNLCLLVCPPHEGDSPYFSRVPAFGLPCDVVDCECLMYRPTK